MGTLAGSACHLSSPATVGRAAAPWWPIRRARPHGARTVPRRGAADVAGNHHVPRCRAGVAAHAALRDICPVCRQRSPGATLSAHSAAGGRGAAEPRGSHSVVVGDICPHRVADRPGSRVVRAVRVARGAGRCGWRGWRVVRWRRLHRGWSATDRPTGEGRGAARTGPDFLAQLPAVRRALGGFRPPGRQWGSAGGADR